ncbi:MAG: hypothetical protein JEZ04_18250 [Spirochaetales bacterium]|nr:hypothetical protein [Spirochaetales bacterium]
MNNTRIHETKRLPTLALLFFTSVLLYLLSGLLYSWGTPKWFDHFPGSSCYRFLLAVGVFFLCCASFFALRITTPISGIIGSYYMTFCLSFIPVPIFSFLVLFNNPIQILQTFSMITDVIIWILGVIILYTRLRRNTSDNKNTEAGRIWFCWASLMVCTGTLYLLSILSGTLSISIRLLTFIVGSFFTGIWFLSRKKEDLHEAAARYNLSPREKEVLELLVEGKTNIEIADLLFISLSTVKTHIRTIFEKTGAKNRLEAASLCRKS